MTAKEFQKLVTRDESDFLDRFLALLAELKLNYCIIGGLAVNAYAEPVVTLDCDVIVVASGLAKLEKSLRAMCRIERFEHSLNLTAPGSDVRIQIQTDKELQDCLKRRREATVLGRKLFVAAPEDLILLKVAAYREPERRRSKREKDRVDIIRLVETFPQLKDKLPSEIRNELKL
jgi:hypothetical protein